MSLDFAALERLLLPSRQSVPNAQAQFEPRTTQPTEMLDSVLSFLSADTARGDGSIARDAYWFGVILAARREWGAAAEPKLRAWSQSSAKYDENSFDTAWGQFDPNHQNPVTMKSVYRLAQDLGWRKPASPSRYQLLDRVRIMDLKPIEWRVKGLFPRQGVGAIYGPSGSGKSFLVLDLALRIAQGESWFGRKTTACPVTYVMLEGEAGLRNRIVAWEATHARQIPMNFASVPQGFAFAEPQDVADLAEALPKGGVIVVDTLNRAAPGKDENSSKDMGDVLDGMKQLQALTGGLVLVVHHTGKDVGKGMRGHSSLHAALDGAIEVRRDTKGRSWKAAKVKDGSDDFEVPFKLETVVLGQDADGELITSCVATNDVHRLSARKEPSGSNQRAVLNAIRAHDAPLTRDAAIKVAADALENVPKNKRRNEGATQVSKLLEGQHLHLDDKTGLVSPG